MNKGLLLVLLFAFSISCFVVDGQKPKAVHVLTSDEAKVVKKDAATLFNAGDYKGALGGYQELYKSAPQNAEYNYRLGYCYLMTTMNKPASLKYLETANEAKDAKKEWLYYLGMSYMYNEQWDDAIESFISYNTATGSKVIKGSLTADRMIQMCNNGKELEDKPVNCTFTNLGKTVNTNQEEYNPFISADGKSLLFTSRRKGNSGGFIEELNQIASDVYWTQWKDTIWTKSKNVGPNINSESDEETVGISPAGDKIFIYFDNNSETFDDIGIATLKGKMWQKPVMLPPQVNSIEYEGGATISNDGNTIYFSSTRKGGIGGIDLWMVKKDNAIWGAAINLGNSINSTYDETSPFLTLDGKKLYFASKGWNSMGDYDIFYCQWNENENKWGQPVNIGYPINNADDNSFISFTGDERFAYMSAVRKGGLGDKDIYKIEFMDTTHHRFDHIITGNVSGTAGRIEVTKMLLTNKNTSEVKDYISWTVANYFVYPAQPGEYTLKIEGYNFAPYSEDITVDNNFPPLEINKVIKVQSSK